MPKKYEFTGETKGNYIFDSPRYLPNETLKMCAHKEIAMSNQATGNSAHQPREGFMAPTFRIFVRTAEGAEFQAFTWCRDEASGIARAWREGREFGHNVTAVWAEAV
jgi:hypothetical protein